MVGGRHSSKLNILEWMIELPLALFIVGGLYRY
jgi:hypothetical protein